MNFGSDNSSGVHPRIMAALAAANDGSAPSYGRDALTEGAAGRLREIFEAPDAAVFLVGTGTGSNALALAQLCPPWGRIFCHETAHIETSESGGPAWMAGGASLALTPGAWGRMTPQALAARIADYPQVDEHDGRNAVLSITNATEWGTVHDAASVAGLCAVARGAGMAVHVDGARFANAVAATGASPAALTWRAGVDALSLGGTKNGCLALEAVVFFDPARAQDFAFRRMRAGHLWSKHRFLAAQALAWLEGGLWLDLARHANAAAAELAAGLRNSGHAPLAPVEANEVFVRLPRAVIARARAAGLRAADWPAAGDDEDRGTIRLVTGWTTTAEEIAALLAVL
ncbi:threonine aldolase family protein [Paracoccus contaminans]|uniref:Low specificity L-threonine aldolase n=1 Tax=Paracoccus contaminans TaxID=1945662 RepID=A0A1W6D030_9RHOB|nr:beta-eliminating lyase-related protein [Paracoccus contaminans]ARJ70481.1 low specificity L-threonine aldolase [Paracoccus contaminans]